ncbi:MAG: ABC transporter ATP-binding protein [Planctomycetota bacterium]
MSKKAPRNNKPVQDNVIVEDLDIIEAQREGHYEKPSLRRLLFPGKDKDLLRWRRLFSFARPYTIKIIFCLLLSSIVGGATVGKLWFVESGLEPMVNPEKIQEDPFESFKEMFADKVSLLKSKADLLQSDPPAEGGAPENKALEDMASASGETDSKTAAEAAAGTIDPSEDKPDSKVKNFDPSLAKKRLMFVLILFMLLIFFEQFGNYFQHVMIRSIGHRIVMDIRNALFARVTSFSLKFHNKNHSGKLISRLTNDLGVFGNFFTQTAVGFTVDLFMLLGIIVHLLLKGGWYIVGILLLISIAFLPIQAIGRKIRRRDKLTQRSTSLIYSVLSESFTGQKIIKAFTSEDYEYERFRQVSAKTYRNTMKTARLRSFTQPVVELSGALVAGVLLLFLGTQVINQTTTFSEMASIVAALIWAIGPLRRLARANNNIQSALASADRVATLLYAEAEIQDKPDAKDLIEFKKSIHYDHVYFEHDQGIPVLNNICLEIHKGEVVALVGPSGSGKTTLVDLLPRFYDVIKGALKLDGIDIRDLKVRSLRQMIGIVSQEAILFNDTVGMNISYGMPEKTQEEIEAAARAANAHDFIAEMEDGYDTLIGERGVRLSGGQKQRIAIARAILKNPPILILHEATSALDSESEHQVQEALSRLMVGRTTLVIAHRLSTIRGADRIVVIKDNEIRETGCHEELMAANGVYAKLHELQTHVPGQI